jgi:hypothetical protein
MFTLISNTNAVSIGAFPGIPARCCLRADRIKRRTRRDALRDSQDVSWDPEGLYKDRDTKISFFKDLDGTETSKSDVPDIDSKFLEKHPVRPFKGTISDMKKFKKTLADKYMPVDIDIPGLSILHLDPPIFSVEEVFSPEECKLIIQKLKGTGRMAQSTIGAGNLYSSNVSGSNRRTSSSVLINDELQEEFPEIREFAQSFQNKVYRILQGDRLGPWGPPGKQPLFEQYCFEALQAAHYQHGQHFLEHEDAFPTDLADQNRFQRHATALLYLNSVSSGGETFFNHLGVSVKPKEGSLLIFFPAMADGTPDHRTLHVAKDAEDVKWVSQQWIARGYNTAMASHKEIQSGERDMQRVLKNKKKRRSPNKKSAGFG